MKLKNILILAAATMLTATAAQAEHEHNWGFNDRFNYAHEGELFAPHEFTLDAFANYGTTARRSFGGLFTHNIRHGTFGGGIGANYFFTKYLGAGADTELGDNGGKLFDSATANFIVRLPLDAAHLAPYFFAGGGGQFDPKSQWLADVGAGIDFRFNRWTGIFVDGRYNFLDQSADYGLFRAGLRLAF